MTFTILTINPGSTSTKLAVFKNERQVSNFEVFYKKKSLVRFKSVFEQLALRRETIFSCLKEKNISLQDVDCFIGRGGVLPPLPGGVYKICQNMLRDTAEARFGEHACNLGAHLAHELATEYSKPCFVVDPPSTDEVIPIARVTGLPDINRRFLTHALSQRGIGRIAAKELGLKYEACRFIVAHLGGGISMGAHKFGMIQDAISAYDGEGPFSPERSGAIAALDILDLIDAGKSTSELRKTLTCESGLWAHLGTSDLCEVEKNAGTDPKCTLLLDAMAYNIAKGIAQMAPLLYDSKISSKIDGIVLTGGMVRSEYLMDKIRHHVSWIAPLLLYPESCEMQALGSAGLRILEKKEIAKAYMSPGC